MDVEHILSKLEGVKKTGNFWMARCPYHKDKTPSLSVRPVPGRVLLHCFAGCDVLDILEAMDLTWDSLFEDELNKIRPTLRVQDRRWLADKHSYDFALAFVAKNSLAELTHEDHNAKAGCHARLNELRQRYGDMEFKQIFEEWKDWTRTNSYNR